MPHKHRCRLVIAGKCYGDGSPDKYKKVPGLRTKPPCNFCAFFKHVTGGSVTTPLYRDEK